MMNDSLFIRPYREDDLSEVIDLWERCGLVVPWNSPERDITRKMAVQRQLFLVGKVGEKLVATVMGGYEGHRGWMNYLAVEPSVQRHGYGAEIVSSLEVLLRERGCPKINLQIRTGNSNVIQFYSSLGYSVDDVISMGKRLVVDQQSED